ncbi:MAG: hypothetical protein PWR15_727 [Bacteroidota bacterium]|jgi:hypothetical protein|nr:hypothetical protein [Bacteroidota bacterium]
MSESQSIEYKSVLKDKLFLKLVPMTLLWTDFQKKNFNNYV